MPFFSGGGSGASLTHQSTPLVLTDAQIKALPTTGVQALAAPGANLIAFPIFTVAAADTLAGQYTNIDAADSILSLVWSGDGLTDAQIICVGDGTLNQVSDLLSSGIVHITCASNNVAYSSSFALTTTGQMLDPNSQDVVNAPLLVKATNGTGNFLDGNAANTLTITFLYVLWNITTGAFE